MSKRSVVTWGVFLVFSFSGCETVVSEHEDYRMQNAKARSYQDLQIEKLEKLSEQYPKRSDYLYQMAGLYFDKSDYHESAVLLQRAISIDPRFARYHYHLGRVYLAMGELDLAADSFQRAVELASPERYSGPLAALAYVYARQEKLNEATDAFERCVAVEPENPRYYYMLGALYDMRGERGLAVRYLREYLQRGGTRYQSRAIELLESLGISVDKSQLKKSPKRQAGSDDDFVLENDSL